MTELQKDVRRSKRLEKERLATKEREKQSAINAQKHRKRKKK